MLDQLQYRCTCWACKLDRIVPVPMMIGEFLNGAYLLAYSTVPTWRDVRGGFFVFRDAPDVVVDYFANVADPVGEDDVRLQAQAKQEYALRVMRQKKVHHEQATH